MMCDPKIGVDVRHATASERERERERERPLYLAWENWEAGLVVLMLGSLCIDVEGLGLLRHKHITQDQIIDYR